LTRRLQEINRKAVTEGATTYLNTKVEEINITAGAFKIKVKTEGKGKEKEFRSKIGVIATGFELNSLKEVLKRPKDFLFGIQTDINMPISTDNR
jgi:flavin-dependent dehydrogenase